MTLVTSVCKIISTKSYCIKNQHARVILCLIRFPRNEESRKKWLDFCGINEVVLSTATKLCSNHFEEDELIYKSKITFIKSNALPTITNKKRKKRLDCSLKKSKNLKTISEEITNNETVDDKIDHNDGTAYNMIVNDEIVTNDEIITNGIVYMTANDGIVDETLDDGIVDMNVNNRIVTNGGISDGIVDKTIHCDNDIITNKIVHIEIHRDDRITDQVAKFLYLPNCRSSIYTFKL